MFEHWRTISILVGLLLTGGSVVIAFYGFKEDMKKFSEDLDKRSEAARGRIYERLDEYKQMSDKVFVRRDMCDQTLKFNSEIYQRVEQAVTKLSIEVEELKKLIMELMLNNKGGNNG